MMKKPQFLRLTQVGIMLTLLASGSAWGELRFDSGNRRVSLIELYTSQGCSSCPPADSWLAGLKEEPELWKKIVPLAFHVDYWDYIGWKDPFGHPTYSQRQRRYERERGVRFVYTPGFVVDGAEWQSWAKGDDLPSGKRAGGRLELTLNEKRVEAQFKVRGKPKNDLTLNLALLAFDIRSEIDAGENHGRTLEQEFVVVGYKQVVSTTGRWETILPRPRRDATDRYALAAWVSANGRQAPLQATGGWIPKELVE